MPIPELSAQVLSKSRPQQARARTVGKLLREAECLARVQSCDNVVTLRGIFEDASSAYLVMEHCSGGDLEQLLEVCFLGAMWHLRHARQPKLRRCRGPHPPTPIAPSSYTPTPGPSPPPAS